MAQGAERPEEPAYDAPRVAMPASDPDGKLTVIEAREILEALESAGELARAAAGVAAAAREFAADAGDKEAMELADSATELASAANLDAEDALYNRAPPFRALDAALKAAGAAAVALGAAQRAFEGREK